MGHRSHRGRTRAPPEPPLRAPAGSTPPGRRRAAGAYAEELACAFLAARGWEIEHRNFIGGGGELDIVARCQEVLVFVEVRARAHDRLVTPEESIGPGKRRRLEGAARAYLARRWRGRWPAAMRFDVLGIVLGPPPRFRLLEEAFTCGE